MRWLLGNDGDIAVTPGRSVAGVLHGLIDPGAAIDFVVAADVDEVIPEATVRGISVRAPEQPVCPGVTGKVVSAGVAVDDVAASVAGHGIAALSSDYVVKIGGAIYGVRGTRA